jgi:hypothetical protein
VIPLLVQIILNIYWDYLKGGPIRRVGGGTNPRGFPFLLAVGDAPPQAAIVPVVEPGRGRIAVAEAAP